MASLECSARKRIEQDSSSLFFGAGSLLSSFEEIGDFLRGR